jgi:hypothetical protein
MPAIPTPPRDLEMRVPLLPTTEDQDEQLSSEVSATSKYRFSLCPGLSCQRKTATRRAGGGAASELLLPDERLQLG